MLKTEKKRFSKKAIDVNGTSDTEPGGKRRRSRGSNRQERYITTERTLNPRPAHRRKNGISGSHGYLLTFLLLISTFLIYDFLFKVKTPEFNLTSIQANLQSRLCGQDEAINTILKNLAVFENREGLKVLSFVGSTGVGKTFTANILREYFEPNVFEVRGSFNEHSLSNSFQGGSYKLLIFDDLSVKDVEFLLTILEKLPQDVPLLVICIFNIQETDDHLNYVIKYEYIDEIVNNFELAKNIESDIVKFQEFNHDTVRTWAENLITSKGLNLGEKLDSVLETHNVKFYGLKGLSSKLNLEL